MSEAWQYQLRINLDEARAAAARENPTDALIAPLMAVLERHDAVLKSQYDAFAAYCAEAEQNGIEAYHLYHWTKDTIEDPAKKEKHLRSFTLYVGGREVYDKAEADALDADLQPLLASGLLERLAKHDTNPANNPQMPAKYRK